MRHINGQYWLDTDERNYLVVKERIAGEDSKTPGEKKYETVRWYSTADAALNYILGERVKHALMTNDAIWAEVKECIDKIVGKL